MKNDRAHGRKLCPACAYEMQKKRARANAHAAERKDLKESLAIKKAGTAPTKPAGPTPAQAQKERDRAFNERVKLQARQCLTCRWRVMDNPNHRLIGCGFLLKNDRCRDRGKGPGKCGSYERRQPDEGKA